MILYLAPTSKSSPIVYPKPLTSLQKGPCYTCVTCNTVICPYSSDSWCLCRGVDEACHPPGAVWPEAQRLWHDPGNLTIIELVYMWGGLGGRYLPLSRGFIGLMICTIMLNWLFIMFFTICVQTRRTYECPRTLSVHVGPSSGWVFSNYLYKKNLNQTCILWHVCDLIFIVTTFYTLFWKWTC